MARQVDVFPEFLKWLDVEGGVWSTMQSKGTASVSAKVTKPATTLYSNDGNTEVKCYGCNKTGHFKSNCPESGGQSGQGKGRGVAAKKVEPSGFLNTESLTALTVKMIVRIVTRTNVTVCTNWISMHASKC